MRADEFASDARVEVIHRWQSNQPQRMDARVAVHDIEKPCRRRIFTRASLILAQPKSFSVRSARTIFKSTNSSRPAWHVAQAAATPPNQLRIYAEIAVNDVHLPRLSVLLRLLGS